MGLGVGLGVQERYSLPYYMVMTPGDQVSTSMWLIVTNLGQTRLDVQRCLSEDVQQQLMPLQRLVPPELLHHMLHEG